MPGSLDGGAEGTLVLGADAALATRFNLGPVGNVAAQALEVLVVNVLDVFHTEGAHPTAGGVASPGTAARPGTSLRAGAALLVAAGSSRSGSLTWPPRSGSRLAGRSRWGRRCGCCRCGCRCRHTCYVPPLLFALFLPIKAEICPEIPGPRRAGRQCRRTGRRIRRPCRGCRPCRHRESCSRPCRGRRHRRRGHGRLPYRRGNRAFAFESFSRH